METTCVCLCLLLQLFLNAFAQDLPKQVPVVLTSWWQIADEDYDAGEYSNKPAPGEPTKRTHQEVSDFTIYQAANGKWELISAVRHTKFPGEGHFLMRWEADHITDQHWENKGVFWTTHDFPESAGYTEGVFYAPYCVKADGKYYLFHNSSGKGYLLVGDDGIHFKSWQNPDGSFPIFDAGDGGRDLMALDNRERDGLWYVYYTHADRNRPELKDRQFSDVYVRTAKTPTGPWSDEHTAGMGTPNRPRSIVHSAADFVNTESQFVIYHDGFYFKFEQGNVVASRDPQDFAGKPVVASMFPNFSYPEQWWPGLAPEIVKDGDKMYIAYFMNHHEHPLGTLKQGGVFVAELGWVDYRK